VGGWVGVGFDRIGFIRPAIASVTEPEVLSGVDSRDLASSFFSSDFSFLATSFLKQTYEKKSLNINHPQIKIRSGCPYTRANMKNWYGNDE